MTQDPRALAMAAVGGVAQKRGEDVALLDMREVTLVADYFLLVTGNSTVHVQAIADGVEEALERAGARPLGRDGYAAGRWVLLDYGALVVHVFQAEMRAFYDLERLWGDAIRMPLDGGEPDGVPGSADPAAGRRPRQPAVSP